MITFNENISDYRKTIEDASQLLDRKCTSFEQKLELFENLYNLLSDCFPIEIKKLRLYSVNRLNGAIDKEYLIKYETKGYIDSNFNAISSFVEKKRKSFDIRSINDCFYVKKIRILNFRSISDMTLDFQKGINVLIGDNGVGKTSILDAIAISLKEAIGSYNITQKNLLKKDISYGEDYASIGSIICDNEREYYSIRCKNTRSTKPLFNRGSLDKTNGQTDISEYMNNHYIYPIISYHCISDGKQEVPYKTKRFDSMQGYAGCLNGRADLKLVATWLEKSQSYEIKKYIKLINEFVSFVVADEAKVVYKDNGELYVETKRKTLPLSYMSSGFQTILNLVMDISYRLIVLNPSIQEPSKMFGVVLIDEIELHLHPKWQWKILSCLEKLFPNIQFIISTHSPMIISSCERCNLIPLIRNEKEKIEYIEPGLEGLYGKSIEDILVYNMGSDRIPIELKTKYKQFQTYYNLCNYDLARETLEDMKKSFGELNSTVKDADFLLNLSFDDENGGSK